MNSVWQFRFAHADELSRLGSWRPGSSWENNAMDDALATVNSKVLLAFEWQANTSRLLGGMRIERRIGMDQPRYWYHIGCVVYAAAELGLFQRERTLLLGNDHTGASELSDLHIDRTALSESEQSALTLALLRAAVLMLLDDVVQQGDGEKVICALPGLRDLQGFSPFWEGLGRHFYPGDVLQAQARFGSLWLTHVAALLPRHPLIVSLLEPLAQAAVGTADEGAADLLSALSKTGFRAGQHVTLFDGGPVFEAQLEPSRASSAWQAVTLRVLANQQNAQPTLIATERGQSIWQIPAQFAEIGLLVSAQTAALLGLVDDQTVWVASP